MSLIRRIFKKSENLLILKNRIVTVKNLYGCAYFSSKVELPTPPKRPLTGYMLYCRENRKELLKKEPALSSSEQIKKLAEKWNELSKELKKPFEDMARQNTLTYGEEHKKYYESLSDDQKDLLIKLRAEKRESRRLLKLKKALHESGLPKSPPSSYGLFMQSCAGKNKGSMKQLGDFIKEVAEKWKSLPEETKKLYEVQSQSEKAKYASELDQWKKRLIEEGNEQLLKQYEEMRPKAKSSLEDSHATSKSKQKKEHKEKLTKKASSESHSKD